jgi:hypothetical protein
VRIVTQRSDSQLQMTAGGLAVLLTATAFIRDWAQGDALNDVGPQAIIALVGAAAALNGYRRWKMSNTQS